jgi:predicted nucleic acid-binding protein
MERLVVDTDIIIDATRNFPAALDFIERERRKIILSVVTLAELHAGFRDEQEEERVMFLCGFFEHLPVTPDVAVLAGRFRLRHMKSNGLGMADAIIAATSEIHGARLVTLNKKHYPMLKNVLVPYRK